MDLWVPPPLSMRPKQPSCGLLNLPQEYKIQVPEWSTGILVLVCWMAIPGGECPTPIYPTAVESRGVPIIVSAKISATGMVILPISVSVQNSKRLISLPIFIQQQ